MFYTERAEEIGFDGVLLIKKDTELSSQVLEAGGVLSSGKTGLSPGLSGEALAALFLPRREREQNRYRD